MNAKRILAVAIALVMLLCVMPAAVYADDGPCENGCSPDLDYPRGADAPCEYGIHEVYYVCTRCDRCCYADGTLATGEAPTQEHTFGELQLAADEIHTCMGWYTEDYYFCSTCQWGYVPGDEGSWDYAQKYWPEEGEEYVHVPDLEDPHEGWGTECGGGIMDTYYHCDYCYTDCYADGTEAVYADVAQTGHTPEWEEEADFIQCTGGYKEDYWRCGVCYEACDENGNLIEREEGTGHELDDELHLAKDEIHYCDGWYTEDYYLCIHCGEGFVETEWGVDSAQWKWYIEDDEEVVHRGAEELNPANYAPCNGGYEEDYGWCEGCYEVINADGEILERKEAEEGAKHTPFLSLPIEIPQHCYYIVDTDEEYYYPCIDCNAPCDSKGNELETEEREEPLEHDWELHKAEDEIENSCGGWYIEDYYQCALCGSVVAVGEDGKPDEESYPESTWQEDEDKRIHELTHYEAANGYEEFWVCFGCGSVYTDAEGKHEINSFKEVPLVKETTTPNTGDMNIAVFAGALVLSAAALAVIVLGKKRAF